MRSFGDPYENRTRVTAVKGRCLNLLTNGPFCFRRVNRDCLIIITQQSRFVNTFFNFFEKIFQAVFSLFLSLIVLLQPIVNRHADRCDSDTDDAVYRSRHHCADEDISRADNADAWNNRIQWHLIFALKLRMLLTHYEYAEDAHCEEDPDYEYQNVCKSIE